MLKTENKIMYGHLDKPSVPGKYLLFMKNKTYMHYKNSEFSFWSIVYSKINPPGILPRYIHTPLISQFLFLKNWVFSEQWAILLQEILRVILIKAHNSTGCL